MRDYTMPTLSDFGSLGDITNTLGDPFTGDQSFDVDGNVIETGDNSINQCPTVDNESCYFNEQP